MTPSLDANALAADLLPSLAARGDPERAVREKAYLKSDLTHLGCGQPVLRALARDLDRTLPVLDGGGLLAVADALHATGVHEARAVAIALLERRHRALGEAELPRLVDLVRRCPGWAYVDWLAIKVIGAVLARLPPEREADWLTAWAADPDFWVRRTALLAPLDRLRRGGGDFELFCTLAAPMLPEREFFIRKAIGWVLREVSKRSPERVRAFVSAHDARMSGLTRREATKYLPPA
jgi:3-methyladenine DNA glycosylase AlkD